MTKRFKNIFLVILLMVLFITNVDAAYYNNYNTTIDYTNVYIKKFPKYTYYIDLESNIPFEYTGSFKVNSNFKTGGLINKYEFEIAGGTSSYLFNGSKFFTMTESAGNVYSVETSGIKTIAKTAKSGDRVTEYIQRDVRVTGTGTYVDPWMFTDKYEVIVTTNEPTHSKVSPTSQYVTSGKSAVVTFTVDSDYEYSSNTCAGTVSGNTLTINNITADKTCQIKFKHRKYLISYDSNGGSECSSFEITPGNAYGTLCNSTRTGYTLDGWYTSLTGGTKVSSSTIPTGDTKLYARWKPNTYTLKYNLNGGSGCTTGTLTYGSTYGTLCTPTRTGYTFKGWYTSASGGTKITESKVVDTTTNIDIYAQWTANTYKITYNSNGGSGCTSTNTVTYDQQYGTLCTPTKSGINFKGWYTSATGGTLISPTDTVKITSDTTLYAQWELSCFAFNSSTGTITDYYDYLGNDSSNTACPRTVTIPSSLGGVTVKKIGASAFEEKNITSVTIPNTVTNIGSSAFYKNKITSITIPSSVGKIDSYAFANNSISSLSLTEGITTINSSAFRNNKITKVVMPSTLTYIGSYAFRSNNISSLTVNQTVENIGTLAFFQNKIPSISLPKSLTNIGGGAFNDNQLPDSQAVIYKRNSDGSEDTTTVVSYGGSKRSGLAVPSGVKVLYKYAYYSNDITSLTLTEGIEELGDNSLSHNDIEIIKIPDTVKKIGYFAVFGNWAKSITIPSGVTSIGAAAFNANKDSNNPIIYKKNSDGSEDKTTIISFKDSGYTSKGISVTIPSGVTTIDQDAFWNCFIGTISIPEGVTSIGYSAFAYNVLKTVTIPSTVTSIEYSAFSKTKGTTTSGDSLNSNPDLTKIINKPGKSFKWGYIIGTADTNYSASDYTFVTGTVKNALGDVTISGS